jgi:hypothetical protein
MGPTRRAAGPAGPAARRGPGGPQEGTAGQVTAAGEMLPMAPVAPCMDGPEGEESGLCAVASPTPSGRAHRPPRRGFPRFGDIQPEYLRVGDVLASPHHDCQCCSCCSFGEGAEDLVLANSLTRPT